MDPPLTTADGDKVSDCTIAGLTVRIAVDVTPLEVADTVTGVAASTPAVAMVKLRESLVPPAIVIDAGTEATAGLELVRLMVTPPAGAVLLRLIVFDATELPLSTLVAERFTDTFTPTPVALSAIVCGAPEALSVILRAPVSGPLALAMTVAVMEQDAPGASEAGQPLLSVKAPLALMEVIESTALPLLVSVTDCDARCPRMTFPTFRELLERVIAGACNSTETVFEADAATTTSRLPSPLKSPRAIRN